MSDKIRAYAALNKGDQLKPFEYDPGTLGPDQVEIAVEYCGLCHSDLSMYENEWGMADYPFVPGHEVVGKISATGERVDARRVGQRVGLGWFSGSCMSCHYCLSGDHNLCSDPVRNESTIVHRHGGFADRVRAHWVWTQPLPDALDFKKAGPLFCGGITVFNPIVQNNVKPTDRVGVIGIGGLGHIALAFLNKWGCEVTAFTSSDSKHGEALKLGAHKVVNTRDKKALKKIAGSLNFVLSTRHASGALLVPRDRPRSGFLPAPQPMRREARRKQLRWKFDEVAVDEPSLFRRRVRMHPNASIVGNCNFAKHRYSRKVS